MREFLVAIGEDPNREGLRRTPERVAAACEELFAGVGADPRDALGELFPAEHNDLVVVRNIRVHSICEHHLLPFTGLAHVCYLPGADIIGLSHIPQLVEVLASRPQVQETLTADIVSALTQAASPRGALAVLECTHTCVTLRGGTQPDARVVTVSASGELSDPQQRAEALALCQVESGLDGGQQ